MVYLTGNWFNNYDEIAKMLIKSPLILKPSEKINLTEKVIDGDYYWGQFDEEDKLNGYGFFISKKGYLQQEKFEHGKSILKHHLVYDVWQELQGIYFYRNWETSGYWFGTSTNSKVIEGYAKNNKLKGEAFENINNGEECFFNELQKKNLY